MNKLQEIQFELKVNKTREGRSGEKTFLYRNCEDIINAAKILLNKHKMTLIISDEMQSFNVDNYVKATAILYDSDMQEVARSNGVARETRQSKILDPSQLTGTASSYARKTALGGLFLIDDGNDADGQDRRPRPRQENNNTNEQEPAETSEVQESTEDPEKARLSLIENAKKSYDSLKDPDEQMQTWIKNIDNHRNVAIVKGMQKIQKLLQTQ